MPGDWTADPFSGPLLKVKVTSMPLHAWQKSRRPMPSVASASSYQSNFSIPSRAPFELTVPAYAEIIAHP